MPKKIIIAAISARGYVQAAVACGYEVISLDVFADADTRRLAAQTFRLKMRGQVVDANDFKHVFEQIDMGAIDGFLYGSLFDATPDMLDWVASRVPLIGNSPEVMRAAKDFSFFKLLDALQIVHPEVCLDIPEDIENWLSKKLGGSGGTHIRPANSVNKEDCFLHGYYQKKHAGMPISMLFVVDGKSVRTIGFNQQYVAPMKNMPYRFAGAVSKVTLPLNIHKAFERAAQQLTLALNLHGINSLDAILDGETLFILELNPRLSATFQLYENLFPLHLQSCTDRRVENLEENELSRGQMILYANGTLEIPGDFIWPDWVADIPAIISGDSSIKIAEDEPVCTVFAEAESADSAHALLLLRMQKLREMLRYD